MNGNLNIPTIIVIFGATGDLISRKIVPSLFNLFEKNKLPHFFKVVGFSRRKLSNEEFIHFILQILRKNRNINTQTCEKFCSLFSFYSGRFENKKDYANLSNLLKTIDDRWKVCSNKLFYLAVPPQFYKSILQNLADSGLTNPCGPGEGWSRVLVEKPFGRDLRTAKVLDRLLGSLFKEEQIYRIDHYLAKEMLQNILTFRFNNNIFRQEWDNQSIDKIEIRLWEKIGVEQRGSFYDGIGALRDVGQNHLLQMLALITMEQPTRLEAGEIRRKRAEILTKLVIPSLDEIKHFTFRSQYEGYRKIQGVDPKSNTETYFKIRAFLSSPKWRGVPIILEGGKRLHKQKKEIEIYFKHPTPCLCPPEATEHYTNKIIIALEPKESIKIEFWSKKPGLEFAVEKRNLEFLLREKRTTGQYTEEYEKLLLDAIKGDQMLFASTDEVMAMWRFIDPIVKAWEKNIVPLHSYLPDTDQPIKESFFINENKIEQKEGVKKEIGFIGLGKMGENMVRRLKGKNWRIVGFNRSIEVVKKLEEENIIEGAYSIRDLVKKLSPPRIIWLMIKAGKAVDEIIFGKDGLAQFLEKGDFIIDGGNSFYQDSVRRYKKLVTKGIHFVDVGVSGGPKGALEGASLMIGGDKKDFQYLEPLFYDLSQRQGYQFFKGAGAGHFVKMIHNGIEYGMMQAIAEGFTILKNSKYKLNLAQVADVYNHGSVIESRLIYWLKQGLELYGENLDNVSSSVEHTGEGEWTVKTAKKMKIKAKVIEEALKFRIDSEKNPSYTGKILTALRNQFGGHSITSKN